jgi:ABC-2 type transport system permease protein
VLNPAGPAAELTANHYTFITNAHGIVLTEESDASASALLSSTTSSFVKKAGQNITSYAKEDGDVEGSFCVAAYATLATENGESKFVWYSSPAIVSDQWDYYVNGGNSTLFVDSVNWMCDKAVSLSILAKTMQVQALVIPESAVGLWSLTLTILPPIAILGGGFFVWLRRRRK